MKKFVFLTLIILFISILGACAKSEPERIEGMINPGDDIDGMLFTTTDEVDWDNSITFLCDFSSWEDINNRTAPCFTLPGSSVFFGNFSGVPYNDPNEADEPWQEVKSEVTFDGHPLNLQAFGYMEIELYESEWNYARIWNLKVENITPGAHTVQTVWEDSEVSETNTYTFTVSDKAETFPTLSADSPHRINPYTSEKAKLNYLLYLPGEYGVSPERKWPLLIYLHGMDRVNIGVRVLKNDYPLNSLADQDYFPFIVLAPQGTGEYEFWATDEMVNSIMTLLEEIQAVLSVDSTRIYLTGVSAGGNGVWTIGVRHPERFAALAPIMGYYGWPFSVPENICALADVPVWAFHGETDETIPLNAEQNLVDALKTCGGDVQFTVFPDIGHDVDAQQVYTSELYEWLLEQPTAQLTDTPSPELPIATPTQAYTLATSADEIIGTWVGSEIFYVRFDSDGTYRQAHSLEKLEIEPYAISSYQFEGTEIVTMEISVSGVPSCGNKIGRYEIRLLENGNIQIVEIKDQCPPRAGDTIGIYEPVR